MANRKLSMNKVRPVLRCHANGNGAKSISNLTGIARNTVRKYLRRFMELNRDIEELLNLEDPELNAAFGVISATSEPTSCRYVEVMGLMPEYVRRLKKKGMTRQKLYETSECENTQGLRKESCPQGARHVRMDVATHLQRERESAGHTQLRGSHR